MLTTRLRHINDLYVPREALSKTRRFRALRTGQIDHQAIKPTAVFDSGPVEFRSGSTHPRTVSIPSLKTRLLSIVEFNP